MDALKIGASRNGTIVVAALAIAFGLLDEVTSAEPSEQTTAGFCRWNTVSSVVQYKTKQ